MNYSKEYADLLNEGKTSNKPGKNRTFDIDKNSYVMISPDGSALIHQSGIKDLYYGGTRPSAEISLNAKQLDTLIEILNSIKRK